MNVGVPVLGICGFSGAGKTSLIEQLILSLRARGLAIAVVKHDAHGLDIDREGKDSDRFFRAGADVYAHDAGQSLLRCHESSPPALADAVRRAGERGADLVLVEGHKHSPVTAKIWLEGPADRAGTPRHVRPDLVLGRDADRPAAALAFVERLLRECEASVPVYAGLLIGGRGARMGGKPKHLLRYRGRTWIEIAADAVGPMASRTVLLGPAPVPACLGRLERLPDAPGAEGPIAAMRAAMRWAPGVSWIFSACDLPLIRADAVRWLLTVREPGVRAILPRLREGAPVEPLLAWYGAALRRAVEEVDRPSRLQGIPGVRSPVVPAELASAWTNVNSETEAAALRAIETTPADGV